MGVLDGFMAAWTKARQTFGEGAPPTGERFDQSGQLLTLRDSVQGASPGQLWSGTAAGAYGKANTDHAKVFADLATCDQQLGARVTQAANIVRTGRHDLDVLRQWVIDAAASVPPGRNREELLLPIVTQGLGQLHRIVASSNGRLKDVAGDVKNLDAKYQLISDQKFGPVKETPPPEDLDDADDDDDEKKHGGEKSIGKGSDSHIEVSGDPTKQWGHPTDNHEIWPNNPGRTGTFDGHHGKWEWHGPGSKGEAYASEHDDGVTGKSDADAWVAKGQLSYGRDVFGNPLEGTASGELGTHANADATITNHGGSAGVSAFAGAEVGGEAKYGLGPVDVSLGGAAQAGAGIDAGVDIGMQDGKFVLGGSLGAAWGLGGKVSPHISVDPKAVVHGVEKAGDWLSGLFS